MLANKKNNEIRTLDIQTIAILSQMTNQLIEMTIEASAFMSGSEKMNALGDCVMLSHIESGTAKVADGFKVINPIFDSEMELMDESVYIHTDTIMKMANHMIPFYQDTENFIRFDGDVIEAIANRINAIIDMMENIIEIREKIEMIKKGR